MHPRRRSWRYERVEGAGHLDFSDLCAVPIAVLFVDDGCDPESIDPAVVHARTNALASLARSCSAALRGSWPSSETKATGSTTFAT